jgi:preprotein translocase subunit SecA
MITDIVERCVDTCINDDVAPENWDFKELNELLLPIIPLEPVTRERMSKLKKNSIKQALKEEAVKYYETKEAEFPEPEQIREVERVILLRTIDRKWMGHIDDMAIMEQGAGLASYGQKDPLIEYRNQSYAMFDELIQNIQEDTVKVLMHIKVEQKVEREQVAQVTGTNKDDSGPRAPKTRAAQKVYPNDPCPCGSGKKFKACHGRPGMKL